MTVKWEMAREVERGLTMVLKALFGVALPAISLVRHPVNRRSALTAIPG